MSIALVIDDDRITCELVRRSLENIHVETVAAPSLESGLEKLCGRSPDVVLLDILLQGTSGLDVFESIREMDRKLPVIFITSSDSSSVAIRAMQLGGFEYLAKPLSLPELNDIVNRALETRRMMNVPVALNIGEEKPANAEAFVGRSPAMLQVFSKIGRVANQNVPVLVRGESGTGKELVARALYQFSGRARESFMAVNCASLPDNLLESELFGHEKGAFTGADRRRIGKFEACNGGTIFLDEVGDMSPLVQGKVLRLLQEQQFERVGGNETIRTDVRVIAATNRDLEAMVQSGEFRTDLMYRLNGVTIRLPPLRERGDDVFLLLEHFLRLACQELGATHIEGISPEALAVLRSHRWEGNVRELRSVVRESLLNATGPVIVPTFLPQEVCSCDSRTLHTAPQISPNLPQADLAAFAEERLADGSTNLFAETTMVMERFIITRVLQHTDGNQTMAAEILGITRGKIRDRVRFYGISIDRSVSLER